MRQAGRPERRCSFVAIADETRHLAPARGEMVQKVHEERQVRLVDPLFVEREDEPFRGAIFMAGFEHIVAVLHALRDAFRRNQRTCVIAGQEPRHLLGGYMRIHGHKGSGRL